MFPCGRLFGFMVLVVLLSKSECKLIDLNHDGLGPRASEQQFLKAPFKLSLVQPALPPAFKLGPDFKSFEFSSPEHIATHFDAPSHFSATGLSVDRVPLEKLIAPVVTIDISAKTQTNSIYKLTAEDVRDWVTENGMFPNNSVVLVNTGWGKKYGNRASYYGVDSADFTKFMFPGIGKDGAQALVDYASTDRIFIVGVGIDGPSLDPSPSRTFDSHRILLQNNVYGMEHLNNLDKVPTKGGEIMVMPMKIVGGSGAPARVIVRVNSSGNIENKMALSILSIVFVLCNAGVRV